MPRPIVSVIVPTKNSAATLEKCLQSIDRQSYTAVEVIVVDNHSTDNTTTIARQYADLVITKGPERSTQRNHAAKTANGKYLIFIDSDMNLEINVIQRCVKAIEAKPHTAGVIIPEESYGLGFWAQCKKLERSFYLGVPYMEAARFFRKSDFVSVEGYDETMTSGEDWDLSQRIEKLGYMTRIDSYIYHNEGRISLRKTIKKKYYYAKLFALYANKTDNSKNLSNQTSIYGRYRLFFSQPKKLFKNPLIGLGMLFMKTCEFGFGGLGYLMARSRS